MAKDSFSLEREREGERDSAVFRYSDADTDAQADRQTDRQNEYWHDLLLAPAASENGGDNKGNCRCWVEGKK